MVGNVALQVSLEEAEELDCGTLALRRHGGMVQAASPVIARLIKQSGV